MAKATIVAEHTYYIPDDLEVRQADYGTTDLDECIALDLKNAATIFDLAMLNHDWGEDTESLHFSIRKTEE